MKYKRTRKYHRSTKLTPKNRAEVAPDEVLYVKYGEFAEHILGSSYSNIKLQIERLAKLNNKKGTTVKNIFNEIKYEIGWIRADNYLFNMLCVIRNLDPKKTAKSIRKLYRDDVLEFMCSNNMDLTLFI